MSKLKINGDVTFTINDNIDITIQEGKIIIYLNETSKSKIKILDQESKYITYEKIENITILFQENYKTE